MNFQEVIMRLERFWADQGCVIQQPYDIEVGAGTLQSRHVSAVSRTGTLECGLCRAFPPPHGRPLRGKPQPAPALLSVPGDHEAVSRSTSRNSTWTACGAFGIDPLEHDIRFVEDDWESPDPRGLGPGLGGLAGRDGDHPVHLFPAGRRHRPEPDPRGDHLRHRADRHVSPGDRQCLRPGLDRQASSTATSITRGKSNFPTYNFDVADTEMLFELFDMYERESMAVVDKGLVLPAYDYCLKCSHTFNLLDARGAISVTERTGYIGRVRDHGHAAVPSYSSSGKRWDIP